MKVILLKDVAKVGKKDDIVDVSEGYATNFLIKRGLALNYNKSSLNDLNRKKEEERKNDLKQREEAIALKAKMETIVLTFNVPTNDNEHLHHAITSKMIEAEYKEKYDITINKQNIKNFVPLKATGEATFKVVLYKDIIGQIHINVVSK